MCPVPVVTRPFSGVAAAAATPPEVTRCAADRRLRSATRRCRESG